MRGLNSTGIRKKFMTLETENPPQAADRMSN